jgi:hypothetical protein
MQKARAEGAAKGMSLTERPGRLAKRAFEALPTRTAVRVGEDVTRGGAGDIHIQVIKKAARKLGISSDEVIDKMYDPVTNRVKKEAAQGFTIGREGKFVTRSEMADLGGKMESLSQKRLEQEQLVKDPAGKKAALRAGSTDPVEQLKRQRRGEKLNSGLKKINSEIKLLDKGNTRESPEALRRLEARSKPMPGEYTSQLKKGISSRISTLVKRRGVLKNLGRKAGLLGVVVSPFTTGEAAVGVTSEDKNEQWRSLEVLFGLPEFSTGRGLSEKERKERPIWIDPVTGAGKI